MIRPLAVFSCAALVLLTLLSLLLWQLGLTADPRPVLERAAWVPVLYGLVLVGAVGVERARQPVARTEQGRLSVPLRWVSRRLP